MVVLALLAAAARVLVLATPEAPARPAFVGALRVQLVDAAAVEAGPALASAGLPARVVEAAEIAAREGALLSVWVEALPAMPEGEIVFVLYAVGPRTSRALVEVGRVPTASDPDVDRALALKASAFVDALLVARPAPAAEVDVTREFARELPAPPPRPSRLLVTVDVSGLVAAGAGEEAVQAGLAVAAGVAWRLPRWRLELVATYHAVEDSLFSDDAGRRVTAGEVVLGASARAVVGRGALRWGGFVEGDARLLDVEGRSPAGATGTDRAIVPVVALGLEGRWTITEGLSLRAAAAAEAALLRQEFTVNGAEVADLGRFRPLITLGLVLSP